MHIPLSKWNLFRSAFRRVGGIIRGKKQTLSKTSFIVAGFKITLIICASLAAAFLRLVGVISLKNLLTILQEDSPDSFPPILVYMVIIAVGNIVGDILRNYVLFVCKEEANRLETGLYGVIMEKAMRSTGLNYSEHTPGAILNYIQIDLVTFQIFLINLYDLFSSLLILTAYYSYTYVLLDRTMFFILGLTLLLSFIIIFFFGIFGTVRDSLLRAKDRRIEFLKTVVSQIKYIKMRAWENFYHYRLYFFREEEIGYLKLITVLICFIIFVSSFSQTIGIIGLILYQAYIRIGLFSYDEISAVMKMSYDSVDIIIAIPVCLSNIIQWNVSIKRIQSFLDQENIDLSWIENYKEEGLDNAVCLKNGNFHWDKAIHQDKPTTGQNLDGNIGEEQYQLLSGTEMPLIDKEENNKDPDIKTNRNGIVFELRNIRFEVPRGKLVFVIGKSGSGKSSFINAILGEMRYSKDEANPPKLTIDENIGVVTQNPWILGRSIRENIILGREVNEEQLNKAIRFAELEEDLDAMIDGIDTVVGENGQTISGGQRTRLALARCFYSCPRLMILDDPLSALDMYVADQIMKKAFLGEFKNSTKIICSNSIHHIESADLIYIINEGEIIFQGSYEQVKENHYFKEIEILSNVRNSII